MKLIDADKLIAEIEKRIIEHKKSLKKDITLISETMLKGSLGAYESIERFITSLQQEQPENEEIIMNFFDALGDCGFSQHDILLLKNIWKEAGCPHPKSQVADASKMEQPEVDLDKEIEEQINIYYNECEKKLNQMPDDDTDIGFLTLNNFARHFYELGLRTMRKRLADPEYNREAIEKMKSEYPVDESNARKEE